MVLQRFLGRLQHLCLLFLLIPASTTYGDLIIDFSIDSGGTFQDSVTANVGDTITVDVFVRQRNTESRLTDLGLLSFGTRASHSNAFANVTSVQRNSTSFIDIASATGINSSTEFAITGDDITFAGVKGSSIRLGRFAVEITGSGSTTFSFGDFNPLPSNADFTLSDFSDADPALFNNPGIDVNDRSRTYDFTVAVPEPNVMSLITIGLAVSVLRRRRITE